MLKVELHTHTADDPVDQIPHTAIELIDRAVALGYQALAITLHERQLDIRVLKPYAAERGLVLIPGVERSIHGRHVLLLNFKSGAEDVSTFEDLAKLKSRQSGLAVAPHPFFPATNCLWGELDRHADLFDAVEWNAMYTASMNFNSRAARWAAANKKPLVGNGDVHRLQQLGSTWSLVDAEPDADSICDAIAAGRVELRTQPLSIAAVIRIMTPMLFHDVKNRLRASPRASSAPVQHHS
jgi:predicted metal-dependent phosphoesterase TrpH